MKHRTGCWQESDTDTDTYTFPPSLSSGTPSLFFHAVPVQKYMVYLSVQTEYDLSQTGFWSRNR